MSILALESTFSHLQCNGQLQMHSCACEVLGHLLHEELLVDDDEGVLTAAGMEGQAACLEG